MRQKENKETNPKNDQKIRRSIADLTRAVYGLTKEPIGTNKVWSDTFGNPAGDDDHDPEDEEFD